MAVIMQPSYPPVKQFCICSTRMKVSSAVGIVCTSIDDDKSDDVLLINYYNLYLSKELTFITAIYH